jgi:radical SAM superfamily enzyme YgiQ (UPF0313 family)
MVQSTKYESRIPWSVIYPVIYLANEKNFKIHIIDQSIERDSWEERVKSILKENVLCVGVSSLTGSTIYYGLQFSKVIKSINKEIPVVWGGVHASILPQQTLDNPYIDIVVRYEGEETFRDLVYSLDSKTPLESVKGISFKRDGVIHHNPKRPFIDLNSLPALPFSLIELEKYILPTHKIEGNTLRSVQFFISRGCPEECTFCTNTAFNEKKYRRLSPENTVTHIKQFMEELKKRDLKCEHFWFPDDNFFVNQNRVRRIMDLLLQEGISIKWSAYCHLRYMSRWDDDFLTYLKQAGLTQIYCGVESGSERILEFIKKKISLDDVYQVNRRLRDLNIPVKYSFMGGMPTETHEDLCKTIELMARLIKDNPNAETTRISIFCPYPGTELFNLSKSYGFVPPDSLEDWVYLNKFLPVRTPWLDKKLKKTLQNMSLISFFLDRSKFKFTKIKRALFLTYHHIAHFRVKRRFYRSFIDTFIISLYQKTRIRLD